MVVWLRLKNMHRNFAEPVHVGICVVEVLLPVLYSLLASRAMAMSAWGM